MVATTLAQAPDGTDIHQIMLAKDDLTAKLMTWGATLLSLHHSACSHSLVLGSSRFEPYLGPLQYYGAIVGRCANRLTNGKVSINGMSYQLDQNDNNHCLHGGCDGLSRQNWQLDGYQEDRCQMSITLPDGHMGFPGTLSIQARFQLQDDGLALRLSAKTDAPTLCNLATHSYWCLDDTPSINQHELQVFADHYLAVDEEKIPSGEVDPVIGKLDFRQAKPLGGTRLDHNFCVADDRRDRQKVAILSSPRSPLRLVVETTEPGLQIYTGEHMAQYSAVADTLLPRSGLALEPQAWPDAINHANFPHSGLLMPGELYCQDSLFKLEKVS